MGPIRQMTVQELARKLAAREPVYLLDVRQPWEHKLAALPGSVLIPLPELARRTDEVRPPADATVVVYCHHGVRSRTGASVLLQSGLTDVVSLAGGIDAWSLEVDGSVPQY